MKKPAIVIRIILGCLFFLPVLSVALVWIQRDHLVAKNSNATASVGTVQDFSLIESSGRSVGLSDLHGKVWVAGFILTRCAGSCPIITHNMVQLQKLLPERDDFRLVSISVDPEHDTPQVLAAYAIQNGANRDIWWFLTGPKQQIYTLVRGSFKLAIDDSSGTIDEPVTHSTKLALIDRAGEIRGYYDGNDVESIKQLARDVTSLIARRS